VVHLEEFGFIEGGYVLYCHFDAIHRAQDAAAKLFQPVRKILDLVGRFRKESIESVSESRVVWREGGKDTRVIERIAQRSFEFANPLNDAGIDERIEILKTFRFFEQGTKFTQPLHMLFGEDRSFGLRENLEQCNLERRKGQRSIETVAASLPLSGDTRM